MNDLTTEFFIALEEAVWQALMNGDGAADLALLSDDFLGVYATGFAGPAEHAAQLDDGPTMSDYEIISPQIRRFTEDLVLLAYEARYRRSPESDRERMYVSSIWSRRGHDWVNVFSQDTPANE